MALLWLALATGVALSRWQLESEIPVLLASEKDAALAELSRHLATGPAARTIALVARAAEPARALASARALADLLAARPEVEHVSLGPPVGAVAVFEALYFPRRFGFAREQQRALAAAPEPALREAARELRGALAGPEGIWLSRTAAADPLLSFRALLRELERAQQGALETRDGQWATRDGAAVLFVRTRASPFDAAAHASLLAALDGQHARLGAQGVALAQSGLHRFAAHAEGRARRDAAWISTISLAALAALFAALFRSLRVLAMAALQLALALATASAVCLVAFGRLHLLTVAFGATLIGVCVDYPIHLAHHHALAGAPRGPLHTLRALGPALGVGAATSIAGFFGLALSDFPGMRELGVFGGVGLLAGLASVYLVAPLLPRALAPAPVQLRLAAALARGYAALGRSRGACAVGLAAAALAGIAAAPHVAFSDDVFALSLPARPDWTAEEVRVRAQLGASEQGRVAAVLGRDDEQALVRLEALLPRLEAAREAGALGGYDSVNPFLRSVASQVAGERAFRAEPAFAERLRGALAAEGFAPAAFAPFAADLAQPAPAPLEVSDLVDSPLADALLGLRAELSGGVALIVPLRRVRDAAALERTLAGSEGALLLDQRRFAADLYARYRAQVVPLLGAGILLVAAVLALRFRDLSRTATAGLPALLAAGLVLAALALRGDPLTLLHLFGLLLVLCFAGDYGVFLVEARSASERTASLTSILAASLSTVLSFGLLAFSNFPALAALGFTVGLGSLAALALAPLAAVALLQDA